jgi:hypothetical protein
VLVLFLLRVAFQSLLLYQIENCDGLEDMPPLIDCRSLRSLTIENNSQLRSIRGASLHTCTALVELIIASNERLYQTECIDPLPRTVFPHLTTFYVSLRFNEFALL